MHMQAWNPEYKTLDHWRGFAALWVMIFHGFGTTYHVTLHPILEVFKSFAALGWLGVHLFFVISGYCISASVYRLILKGNGTAGIFIKNRLWRLLPVYWMAFLVTITINLISSPFNKTSFQSNLPMNWWDLIGNILLIQPYIKAPFYLLVSWSLLVEIQFYFVVAILLIINHHFSQKISIFIALFLAVLSTCMNFEYSLTFLPFWWEFFCGFLVFITLYFQYRMLLYQRNLSLVLIIVLGATSLFFNQKSEEIILTCFFAFVLYYLYSVDAKVNSVKQIKWIKFIGIMSYSLYLLHIPLQGRVINLGLRFISADSPMVLCLQVLGWTVAIGVSYIFYQLVEKPLNDWRHRHKLLNTL